ncbi:uncharacterized protein il11b [Clupea harengus]|uniref:Uncharacterized protein il11b n=1 Tax=Clupea harengus TaxID=7950 RepID=A0A6P8GX19_CLUHA|nr:uncharacterized protein il11b [Clupea harengus]
MKRMTQALDVSYTFYKGGSSQSRLNICTVSDSSAQSTLCLLAPGIGRKMKLLLNSHVSFDVCLLLVLLPVLSLAQPYVDGSRKENLKKIYKQMIILNSIARGPISHYELNLDIQHNFTALPRIASRAQDLQTQQLNTTLLLLHSGLQSFRFHFDWLRQVQQNRSMNVPRETPITLHLKRIGQLLQKQVRAKAQADQRAWRVFRHLDVLLI